MPISKNGQPLATLRDWEQHAGPKSPNQWVEGRSAMEVARAWLESGGDKLPDEVLTALTRHVAFGEPRLWNAEPEAKLRFDSFAGEPRNSDIAVHAEDSHGTYLIAVEAKADEPFGETVADTLAAAMDRRLENAQSNGVARVEQLARALLGPRRAADPPLNDIRYQLLTACAGAVCEAAHRGYSRALMLVQEFITTKTSDEKHTCNAADLDTFLKRLSHGDVTEVPRGEIRGPFVVPGEPLLAANTRVKLFIGKVVRNLRPGGA